MTGPLCKNNSSKKKNAHSLMCWCKVKEEKKIQAKRRKEDQDKITEIFAHYQCDRNGNYRPMQCTESVCYCVDDYGFAQDSNAILKTDVEGIKKLNGTCYNNRGMNIIQKENFYF